MDTGEPHPCARSPVLEYDVCGFKQIRPPSISISRGFVAVLFIGQDQENLTMTGGGELFVEDWSSGLKVYDPASLSPPTPLLGYESLTVLFDFISHTSVGADTMS